MDDLTTLWDAVLLDIKKIVTVAQYVTLFKKTSLVSFENNVATVGAPSTMVIDMLQRKHAADIKSVLDKQTGMDTKVLFTTKLVEEPEKAPEIVDVKDTLFSETKSEIKAPLSIGHLPRVRPEFTFANFAVSSSNQLAFVSASAVAGHIGSMYNPFFIYGPVGVGKTHLMHAIANDVYQKQPDKKIIYITSEEFTNEVVEAIRNNDTARMKKRFRSAYLLLIDDIQFIEGKERVQEELFHTFNILIDNGSQIALSSDRPPHEIKKLEKRLSSRFAGGLTVDIEKPDFELKTAILLIKAKKYNVTLPIEVAKIIAERTEDTRSLEGLLLRIVTQSTALGLEITPDIARRALGEQVEERREHLHAEDIIKSVCSFYNIKPTQLKGPKRDAGLVRARQVTMYLLKNELAMTLVEIGNILGGRDHTTVMHGVDKITQQLSDKAKVSEDILGITKTLHR